MSDIPVPHRERLRRRARRIAFVVIAVASAVSFVSAAQTKKPTARPRAPAPAKKPHAESTADESDAGASLPLGATPSDKVAEAPLIVTKDGGARKVGGGHRVFRFGEVEVEGRLKSPQGVYFLRRVRAEFAAGDLGHRSFMQELGETKNEPSF